MTEQLHCLAWEQVMLLNCDLNPEMQEFTKWVTDTIHPNTLRFYGGLHTVDEDGAKQLGLADEKERFFFAIFNLINWIIEPSGGCVISSELYQKGLYKLETHHADTFAAICFYVVGELRLRGIQIHARIDDTEFGRLPVTDDLQVAQKHIKAWLQRRWGELLPIMLNKVKYWNPSVDFYDGMTGHGDQRMVGEKVYHFPVLEDLLPYDRI